MVVSPTAPGGSGLRHQRGGGGEVAQLHLPVRPHEGQPPGLRHQPQGLSGESKREPATRPGALVGAACRCFLQMDPALELYRKELVVEAGRRLDKARMIRFEERTGYLASTDMGRTASHFYIRYNTIEVGRPAALLQPPSSAASSRHPFSTLLVCRPSTRTSTPSRQRLKSSAPSPKQRSLSSSR